MDGEISALLKTGLSDRRVLGAISTGMGSPGDIEAYQRALQHRGKLPAASEFEHGAWNGSGRRSTCSGGASGAVVALRAEADLGLSSDHVKIFRN